MFIGYVLTCQGPYLKKNCKWLRILSGKWARTQKYYGKGKN